MVRQAQTYLASAVSATALVAAAVVAFVLLVSVQALKDWPLAALGGDDEASLSPARPVDSGGSSSAAAGAGSTRADAVAQGRDGTDARQDGGSAALGEAPGGAPVATAPTGDAVGGGGSAPSGSTPSTASGGNGGGAGSQAGAGAGNGSGQSTSGAVTGTVNDTVSGVDEAVGGALGEAGVTEVTEGAVNGVAGPESPVGETVDKVAGTVGSVLGGGQ